MLSEHILHYAQPAAVWTEALPIGNGRIGVMIFGGINEDRFALNEDTLWSGVPLTLEKKDAPAALKKARELMDADKFHEAQQVLEQEFNSYNSEAYMPLGDLIITRAESDVSGYKRSLDISTGIHTTTYKSGNVTHTIASYVANPAPQALVIDHKADVPGSVSFSVKLASQLRYSISVRDGRLAMETECPGHAVTDDSGDMPKGLHYFDEPEKRGICALTQLVVELTGGEAVIEGENLVIKNADRAVLKLCVRTSFAGAKKQPFTEGLDYVTDSDADAEALEKINGDALLSAHIADFKPLMERVDLYLECERTEVPTDIRLENFRTSRNDRQLYELLFNYGRYLTISGSRPGTQAMNLQGIWNESITPPWRSNYTVNINTEMNYYPTEMTNMSEMH
ncbi:MAG: glycoside hydrolase family 95 protein, partial [Clostridia bacterium]|nr:glycoside hydrolase family 95 protein [Clostridia bacterium]